MLIGERTGISLCSVLARKDSGERLAAGVRNELGLDLPRMPKYVSRGPVAFVWAGVGQWITIEEGVDGPTLERRLQSSFADAASLVDQSDGRTVIRVSGPQAREALSKGVLIDLHPSAFQPGDAAVTVVAHINVHFWQVDAAPTYEFAVFRSFAVAFWEWLFASAAEYGATPARF